VRRTPPSPDPTRRRLRPNAAGRCLRSRRRACEPNRGSTGIRVISRQNGSNSLSAFRTFNLRNHGRSCSRGQGRISVIAVVVPRGVRALLRDTLPMPAYARLSEAVCHQIAEAANCCIRGEWGIATCSDRTRAIADLVSTGEAMLSPHRGALIRKCCFEQSAAGLTAHAGPDSLAGTEMEGAVQKSGTRANQNGRCIPILGVDLPAERYPADFDRDSHRVLAARCDGADEAGAVSTIKQHKTFVCTLLQPIKVATSAPSNDAVRVIDACNSFAWIRHRVLGLESPGPSQVAGMHAASQCDQ